ncbi:MAG: hypothetical protein M3Y12_15250 [Bacteroidota bacterium]|nr:hypothetical protein [Bacteroidota bacterium]
MAIPLLKHVDGETLEFEFIPMVEESFGLSFGENELIPIATFGQFCDLVLAKLPLAEHADGTSQHAFYKLRQALAPHVAAAIVPAASLAELLPKSRQQREKIIDAVEATLGFPLYLTGIAPWAGSTIVLTFLFSSVSFFYRWQAGTMGLLLTVAGGYLLGRFCQVWEVLTIRAVVAKMTREHYRQVRRAPATANRQEIVRELRALFHHELGIEHHLLTPHARFYDN